MMSGNAYQILTAARGKARLPMVDSLKDGTVRRFLVQLWSMGNHRSSSGIRICRSYHFYICACVYTTESFSLATRNGVGHVADDNHLYRSLSIYTNDVPPPRQNIGIQ